MPVLASVKGSPEEPAHEKINSPALSLSAHSACRQKDKEQPKGDLQKRLQIGVPKPNWANQTIWTGDNLDIMRGMNSESVDLIYLDPPFNSKANYAAPIGSKAAGAAFKDTWTLSDVDVEWINLIEAKCPALYRAVLAALTKSDKSYLAYMAPRLLEIARVLKRDGTVYLHCDRHMNHYLRLVMDAIFGGKAFRNEIAWCYRGGGSKIRLCQQARYDLQILPGNANVQC